MTKIIWGLPEEKVYETGVDRGVFYPKVGPGIPWNGLVSVAEGSDGGDLNLGYFDGAPYVIQKVKGEFSATLEAYTYPVEFEQYEAVTDGLATHKRATPFGLSYRTLVGNEQDGQDHAYKIHIVYQALATPSTSDYISMGESVELVNFTWGITTLPVRITDAKPSSKFVIDSSVVYPWVLEELESILYGSNTQSPRLPAIEELLDIFDRGSIFRVIDNGDGTWTATGPDDAIQILDGGLFRISWPSAKWITDTTYTLTSQ